MRFIRQLRALWHNEGGSALPIVGLAIFTLTAATGTAIDMGRVQIVQARMQSALDAAGLAAGAVINTTDTNEQVSKYFYANFPVGYMGTQVTSLTASTTADKNVVTLKATGLVNMTFMQLLGLRSAYVEANSQITRANKGMELVLVIDTTGSMSSSAGGSVTKIQAAKSAAKTLLTTIYGVNNTLPNLWVGLVPFAQGVNIGTNNSAWTLPNTFDWGPSNNVNNRWYGCVDARETNGKDTTDDPPLETYTGGARFPQYYWPSDSNNSWRTATTRNGVTTYTYSSNLSPSTRGPNYLCSQPITPMTASKATVVAGIDAMAAQGNTHVGLGLVWGWRMLSPRWRGIWTGEMATAELPQDYRTPLMNKVVILMTDGDNTIDNGSRGAYWYLSNGKLGTTNSSTAVTQLNSRTTTVCNRMKAEGILIYTIALGTNLSTTSKNMLKGCASKEEYYFLSPTTTTLQTVFTQIGDSLANLRISQ